MCDINVLRAQVAFRKRMKSRIWREKTIDTEKGISLVFKFNYVKIFC